MDKSFHPTHYNGYNYISLLGLKLNHVSERGHWWYVRCRIHTIIRVIIMLTLSCLTVDKWNNFSNRLFLMKLINSNPQTLHVSWNRISHYDLLLPDKQHRCPNPCFCISMTYISWLMISIETVHFTDARHGEFMVLLTDNAYSNKQIETTKGNRFYYTSITAVRILFHRSSIHS